PNGKLYYSSPDAIYTYDVTTSIPPPMNVAMITLEVLAIIAAIGALVIAALYYALHLRSYRSSTLPSRSLRHAFLDESRQTSSSRFLAGQLGNLSLLNPNSFSTIPEL